MPDFNASSKQWAFAYAEQAKADLLALKTLEGRPHSVCVMLLQMVMEKAAKAVLLHKGMFQLEKANRSHLCVRDMISLLKTKIESNRRLEVKKFQSVFSHAKMLENLHPSVVKEIYQQQLEYPWESPPAASPPQAYWPEQHLTDLPFSISSSPKARLEYTQMVLFAEWLVTHYQNPLIEKY